LADVETLRRRVRYDLSAEFRTVSPPESMTFSAIAPRLARRHWWDALRTPSGQLLPGATALAALVGLVVALASLFQALGWRGSGAVSVSEMRLPVLACGFMAFSVVGNYTGKASMSRSLMLSRILAITLWIGTAILGLYAILIALDLVTWFVYSSVSRDASQASAWLLIPLSILWIAAVIGGGEYHYRRVGQRSSWRLFGWTIAIELLVIVLAFLLANWFSLPPIWR
jgi:hypothetical protein